MPGLALATLRAGLLVDCSQIEFPSILLPPSISSGSIVDITVARNHESEAIAQKSFQALQSSILSTYGQQSPAPPVIRCRNATQTSVVLEWDPVSLATAEIRSLSLYRNGSKAGNIPKPMEMTSTKISGLAVDTEYTFYLVLRTSAGTYNSEKLTVRTHKMTELSGITVTPGRMAAPLRESLSAAIDRIGAKVAETVRIDTTHFVCMEGQGREWEKAVEMNIPVVRPEWVDGCEREGRLVGVRGYYLDADPKFRQVGQGTGMQNPQQQQLFRSRNQSQSSPQTVAPAQHQSPRKQEQSPPVSSTNLSVRSQLPPPSSPSDSGSPAPPPPEKDVPRQQPLSQPTVSTSSTPSPESPSEEAVRSRSPSDIPDSSFPVDMSSNQSDLDEQPKLKASESFQDVSL